MMLLKFNLTFFLAGFASLRCLRKSKVGPMISLNQMIFCQPINEEELKDNY